jgi:4'-phosphopantetheinyl transferase
MPLYYQQHRPDFSLAIWEIDEPMAFFVSRLAPEVRSAMPPYLSEHRSCQWLAARLLCQHLGFAPPISYTPEGRPLLPGSTKQLAISHSGGLCAVMISQQPFGLDLQQVSPRIFRLADRFLSPREIPPQRAEELTLLWAAKESIIKLSPGMTLDQMKAIFITQQAGQWQGQLGQNGHTRHFNLKTQLFSRAGQPYVMAYAYQSYPIHLPTS